MWLTGAVTDASVGKAGSIEYCTFWSASPSRFRQLSIGGLAGYAFARYRFRGKNMLKFSVLFVRMFPAVAIALPMIIILAGAVYLLAACGSGLVRRLFARQVPETT